jgi:hypothetical protein
LFDRHVYFVRGGHGPYAVIYDEVEADGEPHSYTWLLNMSDAARLELDGEYPLVVDESTGWEMHVTLFAAADLEYAQIVNEFRRSRIAAVSTNRQLQAELTTAEAPAFLALLYPRRDDGVLPRVERINAHAVRVQWPEYTDLVAFGPAQTAEASTDGVGFVRTPSPGAN